MTYLPLLGIALVVLGFALRFNPLLVVAIAAIATGLLGRHALRAGAVDARQGVQRQPLRHHHLSCFQ